MGFTQYWDLRKESDTNKDWFDRNWEALGDFARFMNKNWKLIYPEDEFVSKPFKLTVNKNKGAWFFDLQGSTDENSYENMVIKRNYFDWPFCKTNRRDYDRAVQVFLMFADDVNLLAMSSDGDFYRDRRDAINAYFRIRDAFEKVRETRT